MENSKVDILKSATGDKYSDFSGKKNQVSSFTDSYVGMNDIGLDLGDATSFASETHAGKQFSIEIINTTGVSKVIALCPAYFRTPKLAIVQDSTTKAIISSEITYDRVQGLIDAGFNVDAIVGDGDMFIDPLNSAKKITVFSPEAKISDFLEFVNRYPLRVTDFQVVVSDKSVYPQHLKEYIVNPHYQPRERKVPVSKYFLPNQQQENKITVPESLQFDGHTVILFTLPGLVNNIAYSTIKFEFTVGAINDSALELRKKAALAQSNIETMVNSQK